MAGDNVHAALRGLQESLQRVEALAGGQQHPFPCASPPFDSCFLRLHVECGLKGKIVRDQFSRRAPAKGFEVEVMRGWLREGKEVFAGVVGSVTGDERAAAEGNGLEAGKPLNDQLRAAEDRVRKLQEELGKAGEVLAELRERFGEAKADLQGGLASLAREEERREEAHGGWETAEFGAKLREVFDKVDLNKVHSRPRIG